MHDTAALDVLEVELDLALDVLKAGIIGLVDLRPARDARLHPLTLRIQRNLFPKLREDRRTLRARADNVHVAAEDVPQLRELVETRLAKELADRGGARI